MTMSEPLVSIALCTYNGEKFLAEQLDSILSQSYSNLEIIIVDDCSIDNTFKILEGYAGQDDRITVFQNDFNLGFNKNFERALSLTTGDYIAISDQDDIWSSVKIEILLKSIGNKWVVFSNSQKFNAFGGVLEDFLLPPQFTITNKDYRSLLLENYVTGHTTLMQREFLNHFLPIPPGGYYDWYMGFVALLHNKLRYVNESLTYYRLHSASVIMTEMRLQKASGLSRRELKLREIITQLEAFLSLNISAQDREYINKLLDAIKKREKGFSLSLFKLLMRHYNVLFAGKKRRSFLSLLNFSLKFP